MGGIAQQRDAALPPPRKRIPIEESPLEASLDTLKQNAQVTVRIRERRQHIFASTLDRPGLLHPTVSFYYDHKVDQRTAAHIVGNDMAASAHPVIHHRLEMICRQCVDRDQRAPAHVAGKAHTLLAMKNGAHRRMYPVASHRDIEAFAFPAIDLDDRTILDRIDSDAAGVQPDVGAIQRGDQNLKKIGAMNLKPAGAETLGHGAFGLSAKQDFAGRHVACEHETGLETVSADGVLEP